MRILHILEPSAAGVPRLVAQIARQQLHAGDSVHFLAPSKFVPPDGSTAGLWSINRRRPWPYVTAACEVNRVTRAFAPDVVHAHSFFAGFITRLPGVSTAPTPLIYQPHAWAFEVFGGRARWFVRAWERWAARRTDAIVTNCEDELERGRASGVNVAGWPVGIAVDSEHLRPPSPRERAEARERLGLDTAPVILVLGRIALQKGQNQLVTAWAQDPVANAHLYLVGPGKNDKLQRLAGQAWGREVFHVGESTNVRDWLWAADLMVIPSLYETVSLVAGEAMATGLPVVATRFDGVSELLGVSGSAPAGVVVPLGDMKALLHHARILLDDPQLGQRLGRAGRTRALRYCSSGSVQEALRRVYNTVTDRTVTDRSEGS
ncbi:MAG: glycosyltransferase family 4 protein [Ornithinimicrobium sp.]